MYEFEYTVKLKHLLAFETQLFPILVAWLMAECRKMRTQMHASFFFISLHTGNFWVAAKRWQRYHSRSLCLGFRLFYFLPQKLFLFFTVYSYGCVMCIGGLGFWHRNENDVRIVSRMPRICMLKRKRTAVAKRAQTIIMIMNGAVKSLPPHKNNKKENKRTSRNLACVAAKSGASFGRFGTVFAQPFFDCYFMQCLVGITTEKNNENKFCNLSFSIWIFLIFLFFMLLPGRRRQFTSLPNGRSQKTNHFKIELNFLS